MQATYELPAVTTIYPTNHCFKSCKHCIFVQNKTLNTSHLDFSILSNAIFDLSKNKVLLVGIAGGDPLKYPYIFALIELIIANKMLPILTLSGAGITTTLIQNLHKSGIRSVQLSLDSAHPEFHDALRGQGSFNETIQAIQALDESGIAVSLATCLFSQNIGNFKNFLLLADQLRVKKIKVQRWKKCVSVTDLLFSEIDKTHFNNLKINYENDLKRSLSNITDVKFDSDNVKTKPLKGFAILANGDLCLNEFQKPIGNIINQLPSEIMRSFNE